MVNGRWFLRGRALGFMVPLSLACACAASDDSEGALTGAEGAGGTTGGWEEGSGGDTLPGSTTVSSSGDPSGGETGGADSDAEPDPPPDDTGEESTESSTGEPVCEDSEPTILYLSPDDSNSMSSPVQARDAVLGGWSSVSAVPIRVWEFLNYYSFAYPPAPSGSVLVTPSLVRDEGDPEGEYLLQIGVSSHATGGVRPPINLVLVLDTSGSMQGLAMDMLKESCRTMAANLRVDDTISLVTWSTDNQVVLSGHTANGPNDPTVLAAIDELEAGGGTDLHGGLVAGYELANDVYEEGRINRLVLISDGGANVGITDIDLIAEQANKSGADGIYLVGVGVGEAADYNDELMDDVTDAGKGASVFIGSADEAQKIFGDRFVSTLSVAVRDVQVELELPPGFEIVKFSGEEYSGNPAEVEPQHLAPDDAMVFHQRIATCAPDLVTDETPIAVTARFELPLTGEVQEVEVQTTFGELLAAEDPLLRKGAAVFGYAEMLKTWKTTPAGSERDALVAAALAELAVAEAVLPGDADLAEIRSVLEAM